MAREAEKKFQVKRASVGGVTDSPLRRYYRGSRNLHQNKFSFILNTPSKEDGVNGDVVYWENKNNFNKIEKFIKHQGEWINITEGRPTSDSVKVKKWVKAKSG